MDFIFSGEIENLIIFCFNRGVGQAEMVYHCESECRKG